MLGEFAVIVLVVAAVAMTIQYKGYKHTHQDR
jgi:hypothetical protein